MKETREERFTRLAEARVGKVTHMLRLIGNFSSGAYAYSDEDIEKIFFWIRKEVDAAEEKMRSRSKRKKSNFRLSDPAELNPEEAAEEQDAAAACASRLLGLSSTDRVCAECGYPLDPNDFSCPVCDSQDSCYLE